MLRQCHAAACSLDGRCCTAAAGFYKAAEGIGCPGPCPIGAAGAQQAHKAGDAAGGNDLICAAWAVSQNLIQRCCHLLKHARVVAAVQQAHQRWQRALPDDGGSQGFIPCQACQG